MPSQTVVIKVNIAGLMERVDTQVPIVRIKHQATRMEQLRTTRWMVPRRAKDSSHKAPVTIAKGDSGASKHYWRPQDKNCLTNVQPYTNIAVTLPNANSISSETKGELPLSNKLSSRAKEAIVLPQLQSSSLISLGQLCDDDCDIHLNKKEL